MRMSRVVILPLVTLVVLLLGTSLTSCHRYWVCAEPDVSRTSELPQRLSEAGLYSDIKTARLADNVIAYRPQFELWSDGAEKRRWIDLPPGKTIDTRDMDDWDFPNGTRIWKEFSIGGQRIETRLLFKKGESNEDWIGLSYVWNDDRSEALAAPWGVVDARSGHDAPGAGECLACHGGRKGRVLGFSAVQLSAAAVPGELGMTELVAGARLTHPPASPLVVPGNDVERAALGYLHANCSHCHNQARPSHDGPRCFEPKTAHDFTLTASALGAVEGTPTYRTAIGSAVRRGDPGGSKLIDLVSTRGFLKQMPPLATEHVDEAAVAQLRLWVERL
jgi:hypothetical protein